MNALDAEVLVVGGGGPAGAATAALLARGGRDVLLEKGDFSQEKPCGEYYSPGVVDALMRLGALEAVTAEEHVRLDGMRIGTELEGFLLSYPYEGRNLKALGIQRQILDRVLLDHARACGVRVQATCVAGAAVKGGRVIGVRVRGASEEVLRSRLTRVTRRLSWWDQAPVGCPAASSGPISVPDVVVSPAASSMTKVTARFTL